MNLFVQGLVFFVVVGSLWYVLQTKNIWQMGTNVRSRKQAMRLSFGFAVVATVIYVSLLFLVS